MLNQGVHSSSPRSRNARNDRIASCRLPWVSQHAIQHHKIQTKWYPSVAFLIHVVLIFPGLIIKAWYQKSEHPIVPLFPLSGWFILCCLADCFLHAFGWMFEPSDGVSSHFGWMCRCAASDYLLNFAGWRHPPGNTLLLTTCTCTFRRLVHFMKSKHISWRLKTLRIIEELQVFRHEPNWTWLLSKFESWTLKVRKNALDRAIFKVKKFDRILAQEKPFIPKQNCDP